LSEFDVAVVAAWRPHRESRRFHSHAFQGPRSVRWGSSLSIGPII
jgi:hypothetical protein